MLVTCLNVVEGQKYYRDLPKMEYQNLLTPEKFPDMDAIIILKEQSITVKYQDIYLYGEPINVPNTSHVTVMIVKLLDELAVKRYADVEFTYRERFAKEYPNSFFVRARVRKPDSTVSEMPAENVQNIVDLKSADNTPITRKVIFKIPNVSPGDVIQYEYGYSDIFSQSTGGLFYYNDRDFILYSNLYVTLPEEEKVEYFSFPENVIGQPEITESGSGRRQEKTYFWSVMNLRAFPIEPFSYPFQASSLLTAFIAGKDAEDSAHAWNNLAKRFYDEYIDKGKVTDDELASLDVPKDGFKADAGFSGVDSLYSHLRKFFLLASSNSLYPLSTNVAGLFESKRGDASDLSYLMFKILERWGIKDNIVWIRDNRDGPYESIVPTALWFDRCGVLVSIGGKQKVYDFDRSVPSKYEIPWFTRIVNIVVLSEDSCYNMKADDQPSHEPNISFEKHSISFTTTNEVRDSLNIGFRGRPAEELRDDHYDENHGDIEKDIRVDLMQSHFSRIDSVSVNDFLNERAFNETIIGYAKNPLQGVDSFLIFKPDNIVLSEFRDEIFTTKRRNPLYFSVPLQFILEWEIKIPQGYRLNDTLHAESLPGFQDCVADLNIYTIPDGIEIIAKVNVLDIYIVNDGYAQFLSFLDTALKKISKDVVFRKL